MSVVLNDILTLVGRLDDGLGSDTPRERFRRFLCEVTDLSVARSLIEQGQRLLGEQHRRALQDTVVVLGRFLGFETTFGGYQSAPGAVRYDGQWRSRHRLEILLDLRTHRTSHGNIEELARSLSAMSLIRNDGGDTRQLGLCIVTPTYGSRARLEEAVLAAQSQPGLRVASLRSLVWLADMAAAGRISHDEVVQLLISDINLDFAVDLLARFSTSSHDDQGLSAPTVARAPSATGSGPGYWVVAIGSDEIATPEQVVESVIRQRQLLGLGDNGASLDVRVGDWLCFCVGVKGIVGHARVESIADGSGLLRASYRFRSVLHLKDIQIYTAPIRLTRVAQLEWARHSTRTEDAAPLLTSISAEEFAELTVAALDSRPEGLHRAG